MTSEQIKNPRLISDVTHNDLKTIDKAVHFLRLDRSQFIRMVVLERARKILLDNDIFFKKSQREVVRQ